MHSTVYFIIYCSSPRSDDPPLCASLPLALLRRLCPLVAPCAPDPTPPAPVAEDPLALPLSVSLLPPLEIMTNLAGCWLLTVDPVDSVLVLLSVRCEGVLLICCCCC